MGAVYGTFCDREREYAMTARTFWIILLGLGALDLAAPAPLTGQAPISVAEAETFIGSWDFSFDAPTGPGGFGFRIEDRDEDGNIEARIGTADRLAERLTLTDDELIVSWMDDLQGVRTAMTLRLEPSDRGLATNLEIGQGFFEVDGLSVPSETPEAAQ